MSGVWKWSNIRPVWKGLLSDGTFFRCQWEILETFQIPWFWPRPADPSIYVLLCECVLQGFGAGYGSTPWMCPIRPTVRGTTMCFTSCWQGCPWSRKRRCTCRRQSPTFTWTRWASWGCSAAAGREKWPRHPFSSVREAPNHFAPLQRIRRTVLNQLCSFSYSAPSHIWSKNQHLCLLCDNFLTFQAPSTLKGRTLARSRCADSRLHRVV